MLGTHSEPCRGEMSHIYDISLLRVNCSLSYIATVVFTKHIIRAELLYPFCDKKITEADKKYVNKANIQ